MPSPHPRVSILLPVFNAGTWLRDCLFSILRQDFEDWECLIIDDHSTDASKSISQRFAERDRRFVSLINQGKGIVHALSTGMNKATGEYITRMDADDLMPDYKLSAFLRALNHRTDRVVTGKVRYFSKYPVSEGYRKYEEWLNERCTHNDHWRWIYRECVIAGANWMTHRSNVSFDHGIYPEDYQLVFKWYQNKLRIEKVHDITHWWREHGSRTSRNSTNYGQDAFFKLKLNHFIRLDHDANRPLYILGKNSKSKLASNILSQNKITHTVLDESGLDELEQAANPIVLVAVYPESVTRDEISEWLAQKGLDMGSDWWWI